MIRANLLPRRRETVSLLSLEIDSDLVREIALAFAIVLIVAAIGIAIERYRIDRLASTAALLEAQVAADAPQREASRRLMVDVARYQEFARELRQYRRSGAVAAIAVARIGNSLPPNVWVDDITHVDYGYALSGGSPTVDAIAGTIASLSRDNPGARASLASIDSGHAGGPVKFAARVVAVTPAPVPAVTAAPLATPAGQLR